MCTQTLTIVPPSPPTHNAAAVVSLMGLAAIAGQVLYYTDILGSGLPAAGSEIYCKVAVVCVRVCVCMQKACPVATCYDRGHIVTMLALLARPATCLSPQHAVVGSGWSGVYYAWRLAEASEVPEVRAEDICIFEARDRIGGRAYSTGAPAWRDADLDLSLGAYRFNLPQQLVAGAVGTNHGGSGRKVLLCCVWQPSFLAHHPSSLESIMYVPQL